MVKNITNLSEFAACLGNVETGLVVIDFFTDWCGPCKRIAPGYLALAEKYPLVSFCKLNATNVDTQPEIAQIMNACQIGSFPTFCFFKGGKYLDKLIGADLGKLEQLVLQYNSLTNN